MRRWRRTRSSRCSTGSRRTLLGAGDDDPDGVALRAQLAARGLRRGTRRICSTAFRLDVTKLRYRDWDELIDYCRYSAMPVGRFVLDVHGESRATWPATDALCARAADHQPPAGLRQGLSRSRPRLCSARCAGGARARPSRRSAQARASPALRAAIAGLRRRTEALLRESEAFRRADRRLPARAGGRRHPAARRATRRACCRRATRLSERVHLGKAGFAGFGLLGLVSGAAAGVGRSSRAGSPERAGCVSAGVGRSLQPRLPPKRGVGQLVLRRHAHPAARAARGDVRDLFASAARSTTSPTTRPARRSGCAQLRALARRHRRALCRRAAAAHARPCAARCALRAAARGFPRHHRRHGDGCRSPTSARPTARRSTSIATASPARSAGCRCGSSAWRRRPGIALAHHLGRALQLTNILRDLDEDAAIGRLYLPREALHRCRHHEPPTRPRCWPIPPSTRPAHAWSSARAAHFARGRRDHGAQPAPASCARRASWAQAYRRHPRPAGRSAAGRRRARRVRVPQRAAALDRPALRDRLMPRTVHIIGAGLAGLSAAVALARARRARRRARSGRAGRRPLPLLLRSRARHGHRQRQSSAPVGQSRRARLSARRSAPSGTLIGPAHAEFAFVDLATGEALDAAPNDGRFRGGSSIASRRVPGTRALDYLPLAPLLWLAPARPIGDVIDVRGPLYERLARAAAAGRAQHRSAGGARQRSRRAVLRETLAPAGGACRPLIARDGLAAAFIDPALRLSASERRDGRVSVMRLRALDLRDGSASRRSTSATTRVAARRRRRASSSPCRRWSPPRSCPD